MRFIGGNGKLLKLIVLIVLVCFTGCVNTKIDYVEEDALPKDKTYRISDVFLKGGKVLNLKEAQPKFKATYKGMKNVIIYYDNDFNRKFIEIKDIDKIKIEIIEPNIGLTILVVAGVLVLLVILLLAAFLISKPILY